MQLKTIASALSTDGSLSNSVVERIAIFQNILVRAVSIIGSFINLQSSTYKKAHLSSSHLEFFVSRSSRETIEPSIDMNDSLPEVMLQWHKKAVVSVMEAGGLNWLVGKVGSFICFPPLISIVTYGSISRSGYSMDITFLNHLCIINAIKIIYHF